ncbi:MAG: hypothetical protein KAR17_17720 [Cyclobacteriaceae bacterium]|nr:hypothetical protein [Cyclobacteriaceae bacterium]
MRPSQTGWINSYLIYLQEQVESENFKTPIYGDFKHLALDKKLYKLVQPSGLMYGHPIQPPGNYTVTMTNWSDHEKMKLILLDSLINQAILIHPEEIENSSDFADCLHDSIREIVQFYQVNIIENSKSISFRPKRRKSENELVESIVDQRLYVKSGWSRNFWAGFFHNSLLFLDVYYFGLWLQRKDVVADFDQFEEQQEKLRLNILQIIAAAAHANNIIEDEEKALFTFFLQSAKLSKENELIAMDFLKTNVSLENIQFDKNDSWIIRKYILELAILTVWADKRVEENEKDFIRLLAKRMGFSKEELESSLLAIESFVISNWEQVHFLQSRHDILIIKDRFSKRIAQIVNRNKMAFLQEVRESKELMNLMHKMTKERLSDTEKSIVRAQLLDVLKILPTFVIIALPGTFITLPLLLKMLPLSAFPSAFSELD